MTRRPALAALLVLGALAAPACAASLRAELDAHPNGTFAEGAASRALTTAPPAPELAVDRLAAAPGTSSPAATDTARRGPVTAPDLAIVGVDADEAALTPLRGAWTPGKRLAYSAARRAFLARSPAISEAVRRYRASFERYGQVDALDALVRQYDAFAGGLETGAGTPIVKPDLSTSFPFGGVAALQGELVGVDVALARIALEEDLLGALADLELAWQEVYYWQRATGILARVSDLAGRVLDAARARYRSGSASHANLIQAELRKEALSVELGTARARYGAARTTLAAALDLPGDALDGVSLALDVGLPARPTKAEVEAAVVAHGPAVATARAAATRAELLVQLAERQLQPNLTQGSAVPGLGPRGAGADIMYATGGPFLRELRVRAAAADDALEDTTRRAPALAERERVTLDDARRRYASAAGRQLARAEQGVEVAEQGYRAGTATFFDLDTAVQLYLATALDARAALRDAHVAAARLATLVGTGAAAAPAAKESPDE